MNPRLPRLMFALCVALASSSCLDVIRFKDQEIQIRVDTENDALDVLLIYQGVCSGTKGASALDKATRATQDIVSHRRRYFIVVDWFMELDLDGKGDDAYAPNPIERVGQAQPDESEDEAMLRLQRDGVRWLKGLSVKDSGYFRDSKGRLGLYQWLHVPGAAEGMRLLNEGLRLWAIDEADHGAVDLELKPFVDEARAGTDWARLDGGALVFDLPVNEERAARRISTANESYAYEDRLLAGLFAQLSNLRVNADRTVLRLSPDASGRICFSFTDMGSEDYDPRLLEHLRELGIAFEELPSLETVQARLAK